MVLSLLAIGAAWWAFWPISFSRRSPDGRYVASITLPSRASQALCWAQLQDSVVAMAIDDVGTRRRLAERSRRLPGENIALFGNITWNRAGTRVALVWDARVVGGPLPTAWFVDIEATGAARVSEWYESSTDDSDDHPETWLEGPVDRFLGDSVR